MLTDCCNPSVNINQHCCIFSDQHCVSVGTGCFLADPSCDRLAFLHIYLFTDFFYLFNRKRAFIVWHNSSLKTTSKKCHCKRIFFFKFFVFIFFSASVLRFWIIRIWPCLNTAIDILFSQILPVDLKKKYSINEICTCNVNIFSFWTSNVAQ